MDGILKEFQHLDIFQKQIFSVNIQRCHQAPTVVKCREFDEDYAQDLKNLFFGKSSIHFRKKVHNIWNGFGKPNPNDHGANPEYKAFAEAAMVVAPWLKASKTGRVRFDELSTFLFVMLDETFQKWMKVCGKSGIGDLIAYNGHLQKDIIPRSARDAWHLTKRSCQDLMGCADVDMSKIVDYMLGNKKISIFKDCVKDKIYDKEDATNWLSIEDYCAKKKKKEFEILLLM
ncbi:unnamed protein product [Calypogeia fissa]